MKVHKAAGLALCLLCVPAIQGCVGVGVAAAGAEAAAGVVTSRDRRTAGTYIDDKLIELKALAAVSEDPELKGQTHISATSINGFVLLTGEAPGEALRTRASEIVRGIPGVRTVQNEVALRVPSALRVRALDLVITGKVKAALLGDREVTSSRVEVVTESGVVYLMGLLTQAEADRVTEVVRHVSGVQRVVKVFEYVE